MLLFDSNIFIYARGEHEYSSDCRAVIAEAAKHTDWMVPLLVVLELTHFYSDGGEYAQKILDAFSGLDTGLQDFAWATAQNCPHSEINDYILLHNASRCGCRGIVSYDAFFERQDAFPDVRRYTPVEL